MSVHRHKKDTTAPPPGSMQEQTIPPLPDQQIFRQYLRELARDAIHVVVEDVMRSLAWDGEKAAPSAKAIATVSTAVIW